MPWPVSLQISLTPWDLAHAALILPHQLRLWAPQCQQVLLIWDTDPGPRWQDPYLRWRWEMAEPLIPELLAALRRDWPHLQTLVVESESSERARLAARYFESRSQPLPEKDYRGGPFISYFYALDACRYDHVLHLDADMMFGGQHPAWMGQALKALEAEDLLCVAPAAGPGQVTERRHDDFSSRCFLLDRRRLQGLPLPFRKPAPQDGIWVAPYAELPEELIGQWMRRQGYQRLELPSQIWSLHPPMPWDGRFLAVLPVLLQALAAGSLPQAQQGAANLLPETITALLA